MNISKFQDSPNVNWFAYSSKTDKNYPDVIKTFMGRDAINIFLYNVDNLFEKRKRCVLLPAYTCTEVLDEFEKYNYEIIYYEIDNFKINQIEIEEILINKNIDIFYFIHYFGMIDENIQSILNKVKEKSSSTLIMEDRAHYINDNKLLENVDAIIFSFRKLLPIPEGGGLYTTMKMDYTYRNFLVSNFLVLAIVLKKIIVGHNPKYSRSNITSSTNLKQPSTNIFSPSLFSKKVIENFDIEKNVKLRRDLFSKWLRKIENSPLEPVFYTLNNDDIPQGFPIFVKDAKVVYDKMNRKGIYLKRHWLLAEKFKKIAPKSYNLSSHVITLPIYDGIYDTDIDLIIKELLQLEI